MTTTAASILTATSHSERAAAGRRAIAECPEAFEDLRGEADRELVDHAASDDVKVLAALGAIGELSDEEAPLLGKFLAEQLVEDTNEAEARKQFASYRAARPATDEDARLAYASNDPKHPDFLDRIGV